MVPKNTIISLLLILSVKLSFAQYYNEAGIDVSSNQWTTSVYFKKFWGNAGIISSHIQFGAPLNVNNLRNFAFTIGSNWYLKSVGESLSIGLLFQVQKIHEEGLLYDSDPTPNTPPGPYKYSNKGYQLTLAPEIGWNFLVKDFISIYPYIVPVAAYYVDGDNTKEYIANSDATSTEPLDKGIRANLGQSIGAKISLRF